jgi:hypothetical protein
MEPRDTDGSTNNVPGMGVGVALALGKVVGEGLVVTVGTIGVTIGREGAQAERIKIMMTNSRFMLSPKLHYESPVYTTITNSLASISSKTVNDKIRFHIEAKSGYPR